MASDGSKRSFALGAALAAVRGSAATATLLVPLSAVITGSAFASSVNVVTISETTSSNAIDQKPTFTYTVTNGQFYDGILGFEIPELNFNDLTFTVGDFLPTGWTY